MDSNDFCCAGHWLRWIVRDPGPRHLGRLFTNDPDVHAFAARYLLITGLAYPCLGVALTLASAFQAAGRPLWPILAVTTRTFVVTLGGWIAIHFAGAGFSGLAVVAALGVVSAAAKPSIRLKSKEPLAALLQSLPPQVRRHLQQPATVGMTGREALKSGRFIPSGARNVPEFRLHRSHGALKIWLLILLAPGGASSEWNTAKSPTPQVKHWSIGN
jgi:MatE